MNRCIFYGKLTDDPVKRILDNTCVVNFSLGIEDNWKDNHGDVKKRYDYADFEIWDSGAEKFSTEAKKEDFVLVDTSFRLQKWVDDEGNTRRKVIFRVNKFDILKKS